MQTRREFLVKTAGGIVGLTHLAFQENLFAASERSPEKKPNIITITTHDTGTHLGCYGVPSVHTPDIDKLAEDGVMFTKMFSPSPMCSPSRGSLLTGRWPEKNGLIGLAGNGWEYELNDIKQHLSYVLQDNGYYTVFCGAQHETKSPENLGFDKIYSFYKPVPKPIPEDWPRRLLPTKKAWEVAEDAADFLKSDKAKQKPFYIQMGFHETHTPYIWQDKKPYDDKGTWIPPYTLYPKDDKELKEHIAGFQASLLDVNKCVKIIRQTLVETGLEENTLLLFNTEHGPEFPRAKWTLLDPGTNVAFIMRWPAAGLKGGKKVDQMLSNVDFLSTVTDMTDINVPHEMDGKSFAELLKHPNKNHKPVRDHLFISYVYGQNYGIRTEKYKFIRDFLGTAFNFEKFHEGLDRPLVEMYDLENDPYEQENIAGKPEFAEIESKLNDMLWNHLEECRLPILKGDIEHPFVKEFRADYSVNKGNWNEDLSKLVSKSKDENYKYTIETSGWRFMFHFRGIFRPSGIQLHDLKNDPECKKNLAMDDKYKEQLEKMKSLMFTWLEKENDPILKGSIVDQPPLIESLKEYKKYKNS